LQRLLVPSSESICFEIHKIVLQFKTLLLNFSGSAPNIVVKWLTPLLRIREVKIKVKQSRYTLRRHLGDRRYSHYSFTTSALDGGEWSASRPYCALPPGEGPPVPIGQEAGWAPEPVWTQRLEEKSSAGDRTPIARSSSP
jgi:hypothetical protein